MPILAMVRIVKQWICLVEQLSEKKRVQPLMGGRLDSILRISATQTCFFSLNAAAQLRVVS